MFDEGQKYFLDEGQKYFLILEHNKFRDYIF